MNTKKFLPLVISVLALASCGTSPSSQSTSNSSEKSSSSLSQSSSTSSESSFSQFSSSSGESSSQSVSSSEEGVDFDIIRETHLVDVSDLTLNYYEDKGGYVVEDYRGEETDILLPSSYGEGEDEKPIVAIGANAFSLREGVRTIELPSSIVEIGASAFAGSSVQLIYVTSSLRKIADTAFVDSEVVFYEEGGLTYLPSKENKTCLLLGTIGKDATISSKVEVILGEANENFSNGDKPFNLSDLKFIGERAFSYNRGLTEINFSEKLEELGSACFQGSRITLVNLPNGKIGASAFSGCNRITSLHLGKDVTDIGEDAFTGLTAVTDFQIDEENEVYASLLSGLLRKEDSTLIAHFDFTATSLVLPSTVKSLGYGVFKSHSKLVSVNLSSVPLTEIPASCFYGCTSLSSVTLPSGLESIGSMAFYRCSALASVKLNEGLLTIGRYSFGESGLTSFTIPDSVTTVDQSALSMCTKLTELTLGLNLKTFDGVLEGCTGLKKFHLNSKQLQSIGGYGTYTKEDGAMGEEYDLQSCQLTELTFGDKVEIVPACAFTNQTSLPSSLTIPDSIKQIGSGAFRGCTQLTTVTLGKGLEGLDANAFGGCTRLNNLTVNSSKISKIGSTVGGKTVSAFQGCPLGNVSFGEGAGIPPTFFSGNTGLTAYTVPSGVTTIGASAFLNCSGLKTLTLHDSITKIGNNAFYNCSALTSINVPSGSIGSYAFNGCSSATKITIGQYVTSIGEQAFKGCSKVEELVYGADSISSIDTSRGGLFDGCPLKKVTFADTVTKIPDGLLYRSYTYDLTSININEGCKSIEGGAFIGMANLTDLYLPSTLQTIGRRAFDECSKLAKAFIPSSVTTLYDNSFLTTTELYFEAASLPSGLPSDFATKHVCHFNSSRSDAK